MHRCAADHACAVKCSDSNGGERPTSLILSQQGGEAEGSLIRVVPGRAGAALTKPGRASTARWGGSGERGGKEYARNRRYYVLHKRHRLEPGGSGPGAARPADVDAAGTSGAAWLL